MPTTYELKIGASDQGNLHNNIFHVYDGNDNVVISDLADYFENQYVALMLPYHNDTFEYNLIEVKSLTAFNPAYHGRTISYQGTIIGDEMPSGVHIYIKLLSGDPSFRAGGKLVGGVSEAMFSNGQPTIGNLDAIELIYNNLITGMNAAIGADLAIYRPTLSLPGIPAISIVPAAIARGSSTNNRRHRPFQR